MKRDMDLIRKLLVFFDERQETDVVEVPVVEGDYDPVVIKHNLNLMFDAGWLVAEPERTASGRVIQVWPFSLTWAGHDFLDAVRSDTIWHKTKTRLLSIGGAAPAELIKALAINTARAMLDLG